VRFKHPIQHIIDHVRDDIFTRLMTKPTSQRIQDRATVTIRQQ